LAGIAVEEVDEVRQGVEMHLLAGAEQVPLPEGAGDVPAA
jgi:hypothetical protein